MFPGRYSEPIEGPFGVSLVGMRVNRPWAVHEWLPVARAMGPMLRQLLSRKELGLLHAQPFPQWRGGCPTMAT